MHEKLKRQIAELHHSLQVYISDADYNDPGVCFIEDEMIALEKALDDMNGAIFLAEFADENAAAEEAMARELSSPYYTGRI